MEPIPRGTPPHRFLFNSFVYQFHVMNVADGVLEMVIIFLLVESLTRKRTEITS